MNRYVIRERSKVQQRLNLLVQANLLLSRITFVTPRWTVRPFTFFLIFS